MKKQITFYFSYSEIIEADTEEKIIEIAEKKAQEDLGKNCFDYFDERTIEEVD